MLHFQLSTFVFQLLNFFILLAVLAWFFYRPLLRVMHEREETIRQRLASADERAKQADAERARLAAETRRAQAETEALLARARAEAARLGEQLLEGARREASRELDEGRRRLAEEERTARRHLAEEARRTAVSLAEGLIRAVAGPAFHAALFERLFEQGFGADGNEGELLRRALARADGAVTVEAPYPLAPGLEQRVQEVLAKASGTAPGTLRVQFRLEPSLVAGVRILVGTAAVDLSLRRTLEELERSPEPEAA